MSFCGVCALRDINLVSTLDAMMFGVALGQLLSELQAKDPDVNPSALFCAVHRPDIVQPAVRMASAYRELRAGMVDLCLKAIASHDRKGRTQ